MRKSGATNDYGITIVACAEGLCPVHLGMDNFEALLTLVELKVDHNNHTTSWWYTIGAFKITEGIGNRQSVDFETMFTTYYRARYEGPYFPWYRGTGDQDMSRNGAIRLFNRYCEDHGGSVALEAINHLDPE